MDEERSCEEERVSRVGLRVVAIEPLDVIILVSLALGSWKERKKRGRFYRAAGMKFVLLPLLCASVLVLAGGATNVKVESGPLGASA